MLKLHTSSHMTLSTALFILLYFAKNRMLTACKQLTKGPDNTAWTLATTFTLTHQTVPQLLHTKIHPALLHVVFRAFILTSRVDIHAQWFTWAQDKLDVRCLLHPPIICRVWHPVSMILSMVAHIARYITHVQMHTDPHIKQSESLHGLLGLQRASVG